MAESIVIVGAKRTPMGSFQSDFANLAASDLGAVAIKAAECLVQPARLTCPAQGRACEPGLPQRTRSKKTVGFSRWISAK